MVDDYKEWYDNNSRLYDDLRIVVQDLIQNILDKEGLEEGSEYALVDSRLKKYKRVLMQRCIGMMRMEKGNILIQLN